MNPKEIGEDRWGKILIADRDPDDRELTIFILRFAGYDVFGVSSGEDCCRVAKDTKPNLILVDIDLPDKNGYETCNTLKKDDETAAIPVIFLSAHANEPDTQASKGGCGVDTITKPIDPDRLTRTVIALMKTIGL